jgi:L-amino acid N-acyltransferase YncA
LKQRGPAATLRREVKGMATIRLAELSDADRIGDIYRPYVTDSAISFEIDPPTGEEFERRLVSTMAVAPWLVCVDGSEVRGYAYGSRHRDRAAYQWSVDVSVYIHQGHHRRGIGRGLYTSLLALLRLQGFQIAHAGITLPNPGSIGLHEALGFQPVGVYPAVGYKLGAWRDVGWWRLPLGPLAADPSPPLTFAAARTRPGWQEALAAGQALVKG